MNFLNEEINTLLGDYTYSYQFQSIQDSDMDDYDWAIQRDGQVIKLFGAKDSDILCAFYDGLEKLGFFFGVTGYTKPKVLAWTNIPTQKTVTKPLVARRGIRQHINFCMDFSAWPVEEAREYIRNLARMKYNYMTFHSYPGHWVWDKVDNGALFSFFKEWVTRAGYKGQDLVTSAFYYGDHFDIPDYPIVKNAIRLNQKYFCTPKVEPVYYDLPKRAQVMQQWLRDVMETVVEVGMELQFSIEIRECDEKYNISMIDRLLKDYPLVQHLELITREYGKPVPMEQNEQADQLKGFLEILNCEDVSLIQDKYKASNTLLYPPVRDLAVNIRLAKILKAKEYDKQHNITISVGNYTVNQDVLKFTNKLADEYLPKDMNYTLLPAHSAVDVNKVINTCEISDDLLKRTIVYSWVEFDGSMFIQQYQGKGLSEVVKKIAERSNGQAYGVLCNHWKTAENFLSFSAYSCSAVNKDLDNNEILTNIAKYAGLEDIEDFVTVMDMIDPLSSIHSIAGNIGFPVKGGWNIEPIGNKVASLSWWDPKFIQNGIDQYKVIVELMDKVANSITLDNVVSKAIKNLDTMCKATLEHLIGVMDMKNATKDFLWNNAPKGPTHNRDQVQQPLGLLNELQMAELNANCSLAKEHFAKYMELCANDLQDRGSEGNLINYYYCAYAQAINCMHFYGGKDAHIEVIADSDTVPLPLTTEEQNKGAVSVVAKN